MIPRTLPPVYSPVSPFALAGAFTSAIVGASNAERARAAVKSAFGAHEVLLTDSGTSALRLALSLVVAPGQSVAMPSYGCADLVTAAQGAGVRVALYDLDADTLSPDGDSLRAALSRGARGIVLVHFFGYAADVDLARSIAAEYSVPVVEDAAQAAGGTLHERPLGSFGDLSVLSFGRGKGTSAGGGGALLANDSETANQVAKLADTLHAAGRGVGSVVSSAAQWLLGRPALYALPTSLPFLHLGEVVYHPPWEPAAMSRVSQSLLPGAIPRSLAEVEPRRRHAQRLTTAARAAGLRPIREVPDSRPGALRFPLLMSADAVGDARLGILRPYPRAVGDYEAIRPLLDGPATEQSRDLAARVVTLPAHSLLSEGDLRALEAWMRAPSRNSSAPR